VTEISKPADFETAHYEGRISEVRTQSTSSVQQVAEFLNKITQHLNGSQ
jgi:hypothetical protein